ncbi:diacylglycerol kinase family protein [Taibaiella koreensis]|uniref:diacylglycerol kinase family protein n=1 Tax=Taibaiella koreensis TaxID=1268548 RepID=UPI000E59DF66|nr:diacylglycerol kinase family protein [Taibaiella koreensis]
MRSVYKLLHSFHYAFQGLSTLVRSERNIQLHLLATVVILLLGWLKGLTYMRWWLLLLAIALVWITEALNTALERLCNKVSTERHPLIKEVKDIGAAAVLIAALFALLTGIIVFFFPLH